MKLCKKKSTYVCLTCTYFYLNLIQIKECRYHYRILFSVRIIIHGIFTFVIFFNFWFNFNEIKSKLWFITRTRRKYILHNAICTTGTILSHDKKIHWWKLYDRLISFFWFYSNWLKDIFETRFMYVLSGVAYSIK